MGVVQVALLIVAENLVCLSNLLELDLRLGALVFGDLVGVIFESSLSNHNTSQSKSRRRAFLTLSIANANKTDLSVSLLDLLSGSALIDREQLCWRKLANILSSRVKVSNKKREVILP